MTSFDHLILQHASNNPGLLPETLYSQIIADRRNGLKDSAGLAAKVDASIEYLLNTAQLERHNGELFRMGQCPLCRAPKIATGIIDERWM